MCKTFLNPGQEKDRYKRYSWEIWGQIEKELDIG